MSHSVISREYSPFKARLDELVKDLHQLTHDIQHQQLTETVGDLRNRIHDPFMFVIVGEVKVGKSSFINALLESKTDICAVAPSPMTDTIQQIIYGEEHTVTALSPVLKRITYPEEILREIAIVDTPGTNTIIAHHQEITEKFIPTSDLAVFVFEAKNPYRQSAWDFFQFIKEEWRKKIIFVLQQKDLMNAADLEINKKGLEQYAKERGIENPKIFAVSAKLEQEGNFDESGFAELRNYITQNITGGKAYIFKLLNNIDACTTINEKIASGISLRKNQYEYDLKFRSDINKTLEDQTRISQNNVKMLVENLIGAYDQVTNEKKEELDKNLGFFNVLKRGIGGIFSKQQSLHQWLSEFSSELEKSLNSALQNRMNDGVKDISDSIQQMGQMISLKIQNSTTLLRNDHEIFAAIAEKRAHVLDELHSAFKEFLKTTENYYTKDLIKEDNKLAPQVATGTGIAIVGAIITALTHGAVFDITGGVLTTLGLAFAGITLGLNKRKIMNQFSKEIDSGRSQLHDNVSQKLNQYVDWIKSKMNENFHKLDAHLQNEKSQIENLDKTQKRINHSLDSLKSEIEQKSNWKFE